MAKIIDMDLMSHTVGRDTTDYYRYDTEIPANSSSDIIRIVAPTYVKVHLVGVSLHESLDTEERIEADNAHWEFVSDGLTSFSLDRGVCYLRADNSHGTNTGRILITGV